MKKAVAMKWAKALRSGKYKQGRCALKDKGSYCCLGVLCEIYGKCEKVKANGMTFFDAEAGALPISVMDWAGIKNRNGAIHSGESLSYENDRGVPFATIADIIEDHWKAL